MDRRSFLKRIALGAIATLVAPTVLGKVASAASKPAPAQLQDKVLVTDYGPVQLKVGETEKEAAARAAEAFSRGASPGTSQSDPYLLSRTRPGCLGGGVPVNDASDAISYVEFRNGKISLREYEARLDRNHKLDAVDVKIDPLYLWNRPGTFTTATNPITIPLTYASVYGSGAMTTSTFPTTWKDPKWLVSSTTTT